MGRLLVPATMVAAMLSFAIAAVTVGFVPARPGWWPAAIALAVLGGITPMIYAVNIRIVPVFARRPWPNLMWLRLQIGFALGGAWAVYAGRIRDSESVVAVGSILALWGGALFAANTVRLFRQPVSSLPAPPLPFSEQAAVDRIGTAFTRVSGAYLLVGLSVGVLNSRWQPSTGRWELVWAHAMLVGFFLCMASGVSYHVLGRWTGERWRSVGLIKAHLYVVVAGFPLMLIALAMGNSSLLRVAGPLQALAFLLFLANILPLLLHLPGPSRPATIGAVAFLAAGIILGGSFALDPALGARLRLPHAQINLFGGAGLLICGIGIYLVPRFFGRPLRWPRLIKLQLSLLTGGVILSAGALVLRAYGVGSDAMLLLAQSTVALAFLFFAVILAGTSLGRLGMAVTISALRPGTHRGVHQLSAD